MTTKQGKLVDFFLLLLFKPLLWWDIKTLIYTLFSVCFFCKERKQEKTCSYMYSMKYLFLLCVPYTGNVAHSAIIFCHNILRVYVHLSKLRLFSVFFVYYIFCILNQKACMFKPGIMFLSFLYSQDWPFWEKLKVLHYIIVLLPKLNVLLSYF